MARRKPGRHVDCLDCHERFRTENEGSVCPTCTRLRRDAAIAEKRRAEPSIDFVEPELW
jgi:Zn finger protein HypA/HybF involved in hydrogenase expression